MKDYMWAYVGFIVLLLVVAGIILFEFVIGKNGLKD